MSLIYKILRFILLFIILIINLPHSTNAEANFETWLASYKKFALNEGISQKTIDVAFKNVKFLEQVIKYDRKQPEFFEDTLTYVGKRANTSRLKKARKLLEKMREISFHFFYNIFGRGVTTAKNGVVLLTQIQ